MRFPVQLFYPYSNIALVESLDFTTNLTSEYLYSWFPVVNLEMSNTTLDVPEEPDVEQAEEEQEHSAAISFFTAAR